jgi:hypothetical protein
MKIFLALLLILSTSAFALEVDEKLTVRVVRTSESRKTLMVNRGTEDGLVEGDHAKFIVTAGIVARAVCIRVSPSRSVWSVYRLVNADFIVNDAVMSMKITPAVKITKDESKSLVQEDTPTKVTAGDGAALGIPLADGAEDLDKATTLTDDVGDLKAVSDAEPSIIPEKNVEFFGMLAISGLTANTKTDTGDKSFNNSQSFHHIGLGAEFYPRKEREWYSHWSLVGNFNVMKNANQSYNGSSSTNDVTEFEIGTNWHPTKLPSQTQMFIPYIHAGFNLGSVKSTYKPGDELSGSTTGKSANGGTQGFSVGFGYKFYTQSGFGARFLLDYYMRTERYKEDDAGVKFNKTVGGPRLMLGLGYRF